MFVKNMKGENSYFIPPKWSKTKKERGLRLESLKLFVENKTNVSVHLQYCLYSFQWIVGTLTQML